MIPSKFYVYDLETMFNCFLFCGSFDGDDEFQLFEISDRRNDRDQLTSFLNYLQNCGTNLTGFNSLGFDYPILHELMTAPFTFDAHKAWTKAQQIIGGNSRFTGRNPHAISLKNRLIPQIDLWKINHFDNKNKNTSLKSLEFAMRSPNVADLPYDWRKPLTSEEMDKLRAYNINDVRETKRFLEKNKHLIGFREELLAKGILTGDVLNFSDVKIGVEYMTEKLGGRFKLYNGSKPKQTFRTSIEYKDVILPKIYFRTETCNQVLDWFNKQTIWIEKKGRPELKGVDLGGIKFDFGVGGVHASVVNRVFHSTETHVIKDIDVSGMYVAVAIANGFYPQHLGEQFAVAYRSLQQERKQYPKGSAMNAVLKLAGNGVYGNSNNAYSPFYDPKYTFSVTLNGQLQLLQLAEVLSLIPRLSLIQCNTDGITALVPRDLVWLFDAWKSDWETGSGLKLEEVEYRSMYVRDVNNYFAVKTDGTIKAKGAYWYPETDEEYEGWWNKDFSNFASIKAAREVMINGVRPEAIIKCITNPFDFMCRLKITGETKAFIGDTELGKTTRYYISKTGQPMRVIYKAKGVVGEYKRKNGIDDETYDRIKKTLGPADWDARIHTGNKSKIADNKQAVESGYLVRECNDASHFDWNDVDFQYYIDKTNNLRIGGT